MNDSIGFLQHNDPRMHPELLNKDLEEKFERMQTMNILCTLLG